MKRAMSSSAKWSAKQLRPDTINQNVVAAKYAVRGAIVTRADEHERALRNGEKRPFDEVIYCNIGNPQQLGQKPITFFRQVLSLLQYPDLLEHDKVSQIYPLDAIARARQYLAGISGGVGAYSHSQGLEIVREEVAAFIEERDGFPANKNDIYLTDGASPAVQNCLRLVIRDEKDGIMIPIPQYPLYSAAIPLFGGSTVEYFLEESEGWGLSLEELESSFEKAKKKGVTPRGLVVINPGNPTGQCLPKDNMKQIIEFCQKRGVALMADEVYQENVYVKDKKQFHSFKKVLREMGDKFDDVELFSFHSVSKGMIGECGKRGGYVELTGIHPGVHEQLYKVASISLCPNVLGQLTMGLMVNPPRPGDESYEKYKQEYDGHYDALKRRAVKVAKVLNALDGVSCQEVEGALYAFPQITLPEKAVAAAQEKEISPDLLYCTELLDHTGLCVVPGSGFGQREGTFHFRTTILPPEDQMDKVLARLEGFHNNFLAQYK